MKQREGGKYKPDIHPECDIHKGYVKLREKQRLVCACKPPLRFAEMGAGQN